MIKIHTTLMRTFIPDVNAEIIRRERVMSAVFPPWSWWLLRCCYLDQISQQYVITARAKGLSESRVLWGHVFRNSMLLVVAGFPAAFVGILFGSSVFIETIFSLDGLGLLGFESTLNRDYPVMFATMYVFGLLGLVMNLIGDLMYVIIDPRIDFETRGA